METFQDFVVTVVLATFWLAGSSAWANGLSGLKTVTTPGNYINSIKGRNFCQDFIGGCSPGKVPHFTPLTITVVRIAISQLEQAYCA